MGSNGEDEGPGVVPSSRLLVKLHGGHIMWQAVPLQHHPGVYKLQPEFIGSKVATHHIWVKSKDVLRRALPSPAGDPLSYCMSLKLLPGEISMELCSLHQLCNAKQSYLARAVLLRTPRSSLAKVVDSELRELEVGGRVDNGNR